MRYIPSNNGSAIGGVIGLAVIGAWFSMVIGWFVNIYNVIMNLSNAETLSALSGFNLLEIVGIFFAPLGGVLGALDMFGII